MSAGKYNHLRSLRTINGSLVVSLMVGKLQTPHILNLIHCPEDEKCYARISSPRMCTSKEPTIIQTLLFFIRNVEMRDIGLSSQWSSISFVRHLFHILRSVHPVLDLDSDLARLALSVHPDSAWHVGERIVACLASRHALKHLWLHLDRCRRLISKVSCCVCPILLNADNP